MAISIRARLRGGTRLNANVRRWIREQPKKFGAALFVEGEQIMAKSKRIVPVRFGVLKSSGHVQLPVIRGTRVVVVLGYGGAAAPYAVFVHERPARHKPPTSWKFLEIPFNEARVGMVRRIARRMEI